MGGSAQTQGVSESATVAAGRDRLARGNSCDHSCDTDLIRESKRFSCSVNSEALSRRAGPGPGQWLSCALRHCSGALPACGSRRVPAGWAGPPGARAPSPVSRSQGDVPVEVFEVFWDSEERRLERPQSGLNRPRLGYSLGCFGRPARQRAATPKCGQLRASLNTLEAGAASRGPEPKRPTFNLLVWPGVPVPARPPLPASADLLMAIVRTTQPHCSRPDHVVYGRREQCYATLHCRQPHAARGRLAASLAALRSVARWQA